jgi:hypothetical protein
MLLIQKGTFRELVGGSDDIFRFGRPAEAVVCLAVHAWRRPGCRAAAIDAGSSKRIVFTNRATELMTHVTLGPVTVHLPDLAVLA